MEMVGQSGVTSDDELWELIDYVILASGRQEYLSLQDKRAAARMIYASIRGYDVLQEMLDDPTVTEIMVNGPDKIFVEQEGRLIRRDESFESAEKLENVIQKIASGANRIINEASPIVDARLPDGSRVNLVLSTVSLQGSIITIRKFPKEVMTMERLTELGAISSEAAGFLEELVRAGYNIFVSGGTGTGKTTFLNALSFYIPEDERVITIEDSAELRLPHVSDLVSLEVRNANIEGRNGISVRDLIKTSLRMRPDRIIVGEIRGAEAIDMLQAMNTGHDGSLSTGHANSARDMLARMETMVLLGADIPLSAVRRQIASAIDIIVQLGRFRDKSRKVMEIVEVIGYERDEIVLNTLYSYVEEGSTRDRVQGSLRRTTNAFVHNEKLIRAGLWCPQTGENAGGVYDPEGTGDHQHGGVAVL